MEKNPGLKKRDMTDSARTMNSKTPRVRFVTRKWYECQTCSYSCVRPSELSMHLLVHSREKPFSCKDCEATFTQASSLKRHHFRAHVKEKGFQCVKCDYAGATKGNLVAHMTTVHTEDKPFSCTECETAFATAGQLKKHQSVSHAQEKRLKCSLCDYACVWPSTLKTHQLVHTKRKTLKCADCGKWFSRRSHLIRHNLTEHLTDKQLKCPHCKYSCAIEEMLKAHLLIHTKKNKCGQCDAAFATPARLKRHTLIVHIKEKRYKCSLCGHDNYFKSDLEKHKQCHEADKSVKGFKIIDLEHPLPDLQNPLPDLQHPLPDPQHPLPDPQHPLPDHVEKEEFKCGICEVTFDSKSRLKMHILQHTGSARFSCYVCGSTFRVESSLRQHISNLHKSMK